MRDIEGIDRVMETLEPHWEEIMAVFNAANERFKGLMGQDHDIIGRILKCHLVLERYIEDFLAGHFNLQDLDQARLSFFQKATLLPAEGSSVAFVKPGILRLNTIRNRFGHNLEVNLEAEDLTPIDTVLEVARPGVPFDSPVDRIEAFTTVACTFLVVSPPQIQELFKEAFAQVRTAPLELQA